MRQSHVPLLTLFLIPAGLLAQDGVPRKPFKAHAGAVELIAFRPGGKHLVTASGKDVLLWDVATGAKVRAFEGIPKPVTALAFSADGKTLVTAGSAWMPLTLSAAGIGKTVRVWDVDKGKLSVTLELAAPLGIAALALSADGKLLATWGLSGSNPPIHEVVVWDLSKLPAK